MGKLQVCGWLGERMSSPHQFAYTWVQTVEESNTNSKNPPAESGSCPVMIYDGDCHFCRRWIERWREYTGEQVEYIASQDAYERFPEIDQDEFARSVQLIDETGRRHSEAGAVLHALGRGGFVGRLLELAYEKVPGFGKSADFAYRMVARNRGFFSFLTRLFWGSDVRCPTYSISADLFVRALGLVYVIAFASFALQANGLVGSRGILPASSFMDAVRGTIPPGEWWKVPTIFWVGVSDQLVQAVSWAGAALGGWLLFGFRLRTVALVLLWVLYLSVTVVGQDFYFFQWDNLLIETGLIAILVEMAGRPVGEGPVTSTWAFSIFSRRTDPHPVARFLVTWLLFRVIVSSGAVKILSEDPTWLNLTALDYHYWTQPIPNPVAWFAAKAPAWLQKFSVLAMFAIEFLVPFLAFGPRRLRLVAFVLLTGLQVMIALTGNYGFFNILTALLGIMLIDDGQWRRPTQRQRTSAGGSCLASSSAVWAMGLVLFYLSLVPFFRTLRWPDPPGPATHMYQAVSSFRSVNGYGLFATMTTTRPEIIVEGSNDGIHWETYIFRFKPGPLDRMPPFLGPYMPRLDWQMWFAALGSLETSPWFGNFVVRLLEGEPSVTNLLEKNPFERGRPRFVRAMLDHYQFSDWDELRSSGAWWRSEPRAIYLPEVTLPPR